ncbi:hypothetical protein ACOSQ4_019920 [Xanthoceras sorbifolium]
MYGPFSLLFTTKLLLKILHSVLTLPIADPPDSLISSRANTIFLPFIYFYFCFPLSFLHYLCSCLVLHTTKLSRYISFLKHSVSVGDDKTRKLPFLEFRKEKIYKERDNVVSENYELYH